MGKRFIIIIAILVAVFGAILWSSKQDAQAPESGGSQAQVSNHIKGNATASVKLVEYADFQCPGCAGIYPIVNEVVEKYKDQIAFQYVHFPLVTIHQNAMAAHRAAESAGNQGKFWEMYDLLYQGHASWNNSSAAASIFESYAQQLSLNIDQYNSDVASSAVNDVIQADIRQGQTLGVRATPTFYLNDEILEPTPTTVEEFSQVIEKAIQAAAESEPNTEQPAADTTQ